MVYLTSVAQWIKRLSSDHRVMQAEGSRGRKDDYKNLFQQ